MAKVDRSALRVFVNGHEIGFDDMSVDRQTKPPRVCVEGEDLRGVISVTGPEGDPPTVQVRVRRSFEGPILARFPYRPPCEHQRTVQQSVTARKDRLLMETVFCLDCERHVTRPWQPKEGVTE